MAGSTSKKSIPLHMLAILQEKAVDQYISSVEMKEELTARGAGCDLKTVKNNMDLIKDMYEGQIEEEKDGRVFYWRWVGFEPFNSDAKCFDPGEARYLADCSVASNRIPEACKKRLAEKIFKFTPKAEYDVIEYWDVTSQNPDLIAPASENRHFFYVIETLLGCIERGTQVAFEWGEVDSRGQMACTGDWVTVMPYHLACSGGNYYLLALYPDSAAGPNPKLFHFRVDFMFSAREACDGNGAPLKSVPLESVKGFSSFNLRHYLAEHPYMFTDPVSMVTFAIKDDRRARHHFFERFGQCGPVCTQREDGRLVYPVSCNEKVALAWACQFADEAEILEPKELRDQMLGIAQRMMEKYAPTGAGADGGEDANAITSADEDAADEGCSAAVCAKA